MHILTAAEMKAAEAAAVAAGTSYAQLMENAGTAAAEAITHIAAQKQLPLTALLLCGKGNNAGDAFVIGRILAKRGWQVQWVPLCGNNFSPLAQKNLQALPSNVQKVSLENVNLGAALLIDGIFGTGFSGNLPPNVRTACRLVNKAGGTRIALDIPTGLHCDTGQADIDTFLAHFTLTFGALKPALLIPDAKTYYGEVHVLDIGL